MIKPKKYIFVFTIAIFTFASISLIDSKEDIKTDTYNFEFCDDKLTIDLPVGFNYTNVIDIPCKNTDIAYNIKSNNTTLIMVIVAEATGYDPNQPSIIYNAVKTANGVPEPSRRDNYFKINEDCTGVFEPGILQMQEKRPPELQILGKEVYVMQYVYPCNSDSVGKRLITVWSIINQSESLLHSFRLRPKWEN